MSQKMLTETGRFTQEDVIYNDGLNLYAYCSSNPAMYEDPSGYACESKEGAENSKSGVESRKYNPDKSISPSNYLPTDPDNSLPPVRYEPKSIKEVERMRNGRGGNHKRHSKPAELIPKQRRKEIRKYWKKRGAEYTLPGEGI